MNEWESRLMKAAENGDILQVQKLLKKFVDPNVIDPSSGQSALSLASKGGHTGVIKILLEAGANATPVDSTGLTPLHYAAKDHNTNAVKILLLHNALTDIKTSSGLTPLDFTHYGTESWKILQEAKKGLMPEFHEVSEVPHIPAFAIENAFKEKPKKRKSKKGGGKKGKKKKKK